MKRPLASLAGTLRSVATASTRGWSRTFAAARTRRGRQLIDRILGVTGETLVTLGVVIGLFVAWELWWTDIGANKAQADIVANLNWENPAVVQPSVSASPSASPSDAPVPSVERTDAPSVLAEPSHATTFATMYVPRWGYDYVRPISQGTDKKGVLDPLGIGHYNGSAMPGGWGNFAVAGHRTTYGKPFSRIDELVVGDAVVIRTKWVWYVYRVTSTEIVAPSNVGVIASVPDQPGVAPNGRYLTMTTCHPKYSASKRYVVHAEMAYWMPSISGTPSELIPPGDGPLPKPSPHVTPSEAI
jgi:sortase A